MSYLGSPPQFAQFPSKFFDGDDSAMTVTLDYAPPNNAALLVFISGVRQDTSAYTLSGTSLTFTGAVPSGTDNVQVVHLGQLAEIPTPGDDTVSTAKIQDNAVTLVKLEDGTQGDILYYGASGAPTRLGFGTSGDFLKTQGTGANPVWTTISDNTTQWQSVQTTGFTAVAGNGYPCNTTSGTFIVTLPASASVGDTIEIVDYAGTFNTESITLDPQSLKLKGSTDDLSLKRLREGIRLVYIDATQGWVVATSNAETPALTPLSYTVEYLVIGGGGAGGGNYRSGGGGAGGYRNSYASETSGRNSTTETPWLLEDGSVITVTVGTGGAVSSNAAGAQGVASSIAATGQTTVTANGGGGGGNYSTNAVAGTYGSGAGGGHEDSVAHAGSTGTSAQGFDGGDATATAHQQGAAGGGAAGDGADGGLTADVSAGNGLSSSITGAAVTRAGGGGGGSYGTGGFSAGGTGGGGGGGSATEADAHSGVSNGNGFWYPSAGTDNTGSGGGGSADAANTTQYGKGGTGVVFLRMLTADYTGTTSGSPTVTTDGSDTVLTFNSSGSYTG